MTPIPRSEQFITLTHDTGGIEDEVSTVPSLVLNPRAIESIKMSESNEGATLHIDLMTGNQHTIGPMLRPRARSVFRDLLGGLGDKNQVVLPADTTIRSYAGGR